MNTPRLVAAAAALLAITACRPVETAEQMHARMQAESDSAKTAITALAAEFVAHYNAGHADSLVAMYAEDATSYPPHMAVAQGRAAIRQVIQGFMTGAPGARLSLHVASVAANGPLAVEHGHWTFTVPAGSAMPSDSGNYLSQWQLMNGRWVMVQEMWNSVNPMPQAAPAARR